MSTIADTIIKIAEQVKGVDRFIEPFVGPELAMVIEGGNALEPAFEAAVRLGENLTSQGADHTGAIAAIGALFTQIGQAFMTHGVLAPPPATAAADAVAGELPADKPGV